MHSPISDQAVTENTLPIVSQDVDSARQGASCCCMNLSRLMLAGWALVTVLALGAAAFFAGKASQSASIDPSQAFPPIHANAAVTSEKFSLATGPMSEEGEAVFVLDHNSGLLQCSVIYPRMRQMMAQFTVNVAEALGTGGKGGSYIMATGLVDFPRASNMPVGSSVVYVLDTATGNYACFGIPFDRTAVSSGRPQQNTMALIYQGTANPVINRDALR